MTRLLLVVPMLASCVAPTRVGGFSVHMDIALEGPDGSGQIYARYPPVTLPK